MGVGCSRCSRRPPNSRAPSIRDPDGTNADTINSRTASWEQEREEALRQLRDDFKHRPTVFLISQIIMSVQFFKNFDRDKLRILQLKQEKEEELNKSLLKDKKSAAYLGSPYEVIGEVMAYIRKDGEEPCLGHDLEYLIMHDSIAVKTPSEELSPEEEARDYRFNLQKCKSEGYGRLRLTSRFKGPNNSRRSRVSNRSREWQQQQPPLNEADSEPPTAADRSSRSPRGRQNEAADVGPTADVDRDGQSRDPESKKRAKMHGGDQTESDKSGSRTPGADTSGGGSRSHSADSLSGDSSEGSSRTNNGQNKMSATDKTNRGEGKKFMEKLKRKMNGDNSAFPNLSDEGQSDSDEGKTSQRPIVTVTDESGTDTRPSAETDSNLKPTGAAALHREESQQQSVPNSAFHRQMMPGPGGFPTENGVPMSSTSMSHQETFPHQGAHLMGGQKNKRNPNTHFPGHMPAQSPFAPPMGVPGPFQYPGGAPGYQQRNPDNPNQLMMQPAVPYYLPPQPGMNPYQQFAGAYPMGPASTDWMQGQPMVGGEQPYLPGVPLANQNPAVGFAMPGYSNQPMLPGYPYMFPPPMPGNYQLDSISEGRATGSSARRGAAKNLLVPPEPRHGRRRSRSNSRNNIDLDYRRSSTTSSTSRLSVVQDSTTTDDEMDTPGHVPHHCFRKVRVRVNELDDEDEDVWREPQYETQRFLSSERFLGVFADRFGELVQLMARDAWLQHGGRGQLSGPVVQCREVLSSGLRTTARITATLIVSNWPSEQAFEWALRRRPERFDMRRKVRYVWPPQRVLQNILQEVGCNLVPMGSRHSQRAELEWEIAFQEAEIKLISSLDLVHVHCWAVAKMFFTHFLSEFDCLQERHIRHLMFWQFENNFRDWNMESLGSTFVELLSSLKESVRERHLKHYFICKRNLFQIESTGDLVSAQEKLQRVMENLLPNLIILMNRMHVRNDAFPTFDWQNLYDTLRMSTTDIMKKLIPELDMTKDGDQHGSRDSLIMFNPEEHAGGDDDDDGWNNLTRRQRIEASYRRWEREQQQQKHRRRKQQNKAMSAPGTPMPAFAKPNDRLQTLGDRFQPRTEMVLSLFIKHFIAMAERLIEHNSIDTALIYVDHSLNLCTLLSEEGASQTAEELREKLLEVQAAAVAELPPLGEEVSQVDPDLLQMTSGGNDGTSEEGNNWICSPTVSQPTRRDFNREAAAAATAGDMAEWQAQGGARPATEGQDESRALDSGELFSGSAIFGEMRINPAFVEEQMKAEDEDEDSEVEDAEGIQQVKARTSRGEADGSEGMDKSERGPIVGSSRSASRGTDGDFIEEEEGEGDDIDEDCNDETNDTADDGDVTEGDDDDDSEDTQM